MEAFSTLAQSHFLLNHGRYNMPQEAHESIEYVQKKLADAQHLVAISRAWDAFAKSKEGREFIKREGATLEKLMEESGASVAGHYAAAKLDATVFEAVREAYEEGSSITRAAEVLEEYAKEQEDLRFTNYDLRFGSSRADAREGISKEDSPTGEAIDAEAMSGEPTSEEERLDGLLAEVGEMERAQEIAAAGLSGRNADEIEAKERYVGTEAAKAVEKVVTSLRGKVKDAVTREELEERMPVEARKGLISQEEELIMPANEGVIEAVKAATGRDVTGYYHAVSEEKIWHAMQGHSHDSANDKYPNQLDLTWDDFALLPDILDSGVPEVEKREGEASVIIYTKDYGDVRYKVVQKIGRKHRSSTSKLMFVTEWIQKVERGQGLAPGAARGNAPSSPLTGIQSRGSEDVKGKNLVNGMYAEAGDGSVYGVARVEDLSISADVPQFKKKEVAGQREAANEDGTTHELSGGWNAKSAPIIVWRRRDGRLEVISGRHRLAHAKKNGVGHIAVRVYDEDAVHDAAWAKLYDVEVNILEGTCGAIDVAFYFRHNPMSLAEAEARGLMPKTQAVEEAEAQADENEAREDIKSKPGNEGMSEEEVTRERARSFAGAQEERIANDPGAVEDEKGIFAGGKYTLVQAEGFGDVKAGMVAVGLISLGAEGTPRGANYEGLRIGSDAHYRPGHEPIYLWQRGSGELVVIDGHNRLLRAKLAGAESINAYVFTETEERNEQWARAKYYEKNVRERKASVKEVAWFVSGANIHGRQLTEEELAEYGLHEGQSNKVRIGIMLGRYGAPEVLDALFDRAGEYEFEEDVLARGGISLADAVRIVEYAKGDRDVQLEGLRALRGEADENGAYGQGRNIEAARRVMQLFLESKGRMSEVGEVEAERTRHFLRWLADYQGRKLKELAGDMALKEAQGATRELIEKYGMGGKRKGKDVEEALRQRQEMWQHPGEHGELLDEVQRAYGEETGEQMWLNEGVNEAGERVRNVHFSTEERPNLRRCKALDGEGKELEKDRFISTPQGNLNWFEFPKDEHTQEVLRKKGIKDLPIRLKVGKHEAEHRGYGWMHVLNHYEDMQAVGESPLLFLYNTLTNLAQMDAQGGARYRFGARNNGSNSALVVDLMEDEGCYSIVTCFPTYNARQYEGSGLLVGRALFRLSGSSDQTRLEARHRTNEAATGTANTIGKAKAEGNLTREAPSVNIYDVEVVNEKKQLVYSQPQEPKAHFSVDEAKKRGMFKDERLEVENGVIAEHGAHFSVDFSHVSRALFRKPDREHVGTGEGAQAYGWGVIYGAEHPGVNREYHGDFTTEEEVFVQGHGENAKKIPQEELVAALKKRGVTNPRLASAWTSKEDLIEDRKTTKSVVQELEEMLEREEGKEKENTRRTLEQEKQRLLAADYFIENDILATKGIEYPVNYRMRADVDDSNVLLWDESFDYFWANHEEVQDALKALLPADVFDSLWGGEDGYGIWQAITGGGFYEILTKQLGSPRAASEWLDAHGIRGIKYADGVSRGRWERREEDEPYTYNYVIFNPDYIEVIAINNRHAWSEYSEGNGDWERVEEVFNEDGTPRAHFSLGGERAATYGEMEAAGLAYYDPADGKRKFALPTAGVQLRGGFTPGELNVGRGGHKDVSLAALLHYPELFRAYPELGKMRVRLYKERGTGVRGFYAPRGTKPNEGAYIALNMAHGTEPELVLSTLLHESQHAIQHHEGWARGAGDMDRKGALKYVRKAMAERKKQGLESDWAKENMSFLTSLHTVLTKGKGQDLQTAITAAYWLSHGEQEARYAGDRRTDVNEEGAPRVTGVAASTDTIAVLPDKITELGGITFGNAGIYARLMESRLAPVGDFKTDRRLYQIRESAVRYARLLNGFTREENKTGESLLLEAQGVAERAVSLLPNEYRVGLEPYRVWLSVFAEMSKGGFEAAERASAMVPMRGWGERIYRSIGKQIYSVFSGRVKESEMEFWLEREESRKLFEQAREIYNEAKEKAEAAGAVGQDLYELTEAYLRDDARYHGVVEQLIGELGKVKTEKVLAKLLERVKQQLDAYRKDKTLGAMRKAVAAAYPVPGKGGKPVKGKMNADAYRALEDYMALLELTEGEQAMFERERYTGEGKEKAWADLEDGDLVTVDVWNDDGEKRQVTCTKMEYETYACYERMTPEQAEAAARALGEFITTGKQAWENKQEAQKRQVTEWCRDILDGFDTSENARRAEAVRNEGVLPGRRWFLNLTSWTMNPAQIFDVLAHVPGLKTFARHVGSRIERAEVQLQQWEKERLYCTAEIMRDVCGVKSKKELRQFIDDMNLTRESGVELTPQAPDFERQESEVLRRQFLGLLHRKMRQKNFNANTFAAAFEELVKDELMPDFIAEEAEAKYGAVGDAKKSRLHGVDAVFSLLTRDELDKFYDLRKETVKRAKKAEEKWLKEKEEKKAKLEESGGKMRRSHGGEVLQLTKGEAAYRVLLAEQPAYTEMLRQQGYTEEVVQQLREFAGEKVMNLAYALRAELAKRTPEMKALYEKVYGMPFPEEENYFRAFFDVGQETTQRTLGERSEGKASGGGKIYITYTRHQHHSKVDPTMNLLTAYLTVQKQQDVLLAYRDLPQKIQGVLAHQEDGVRMSAALERVVGRGMVTNVRTIAEHMQAAAGEVERVGRDLTNVIDSLGSAAAHAVLNGRVASNAKQFTALFNTLAGSDRVDVFQLTPP